MVRVLQGTYEEIWVEVSDTKHQLLRGKKVEVKSLDWASMESDNKP